MTLDLRNTPATKSDQDAHPYADRWHWLQRAYTRLNLLTHHLLGFCVKLLVLFYLLFCILCLVLRYVMLPNIGNYKADIEQVLGNAVGRPVSIAHISASWEGLRPNLQLQQVAIHDQQGNNALVLPSVNATVSWVSVFLGQVRFYNLEINQPELELQRTADGKIYIAGLLMDTSKKGDARGLNWLLIQRQVNIKNGLVRWTDQQRSAPLLTLSNVNFVMQNQWQQHKFSFTANPPDNLAGPLDVRAHFSHQPFSDNISDYRQWSGQIFADFSKTDLAAWKSYLDYPLNLAQGVGSVRAWLTFDQANIVDFTADLKLTDVKTQLRSDLQTLDLVSVSGRISAQEIAAPGNSLLYGQPETRYAASGHQMSLTNFTFETRAGMRLPPTNLTEKYLPASKAGAQQLQISTQFLDLNVLANLIEHFPMPKEYVAMLKNFEPAGQLSDFSIKVQGAYPKLEHYEVKGVFANLTMKPQAARAAQSDAVALPAIPGFINLSGSIDSNEKKGTVQIGSANLVLQLSDYFSEPEMQFDRFDMQAGWEFKSHNQLQVNLARLDLTQQEMQAHFSGTHLITVGQEKSQAPGVLDLSGSIKHFNVQKLNQFLPRATDPDLHSWLTGGIEEGVLDDVSVRIKGNLAEFPFVKKGLLDQNIFYVGGKITDGKINYLPGVLGKDNVNPYWPELSKIQGKIIFDRESMEIDADSGETAGVPVAKVKAVIPDLLSADAKLIIDGTAGGPAQTMLHYLSVSPVLEWIGNFTQDTRASGNLKLKLKLDLPLSHMQDSKVTGSVQMGGNDIALIRNLPLLTQVGGHIDFNERGLSLNGLRAGFLGGTIGVIGGTQKDGVIRIKADGQMTGEGVRKAYPQAELKRLLARIDGTTPFSCIIQVRNKQTEVWVDSSLQGMALRLPVPLNKAMADSMPLHFEMTALAPALSPVTNTRSVEQNEIKLTVGKMLNARYLLQKSAENSPRRVVSGGIGINVPAPVPDSGLSAYLELASLNIEELQALMPDKSAAAEPTRGSESRITDSSHAEIDLAQYLELDELAARSTELTLMGKKLDQVVFGASRNNGVWQANIDSKQITGYLTWNNADHGLGNATARLSSLIIPDSASSDVVDLLQNKNIHTSIPGLDVVAENVELFGKKLGKLELLAKNVNTASEQSGNEWQIEKLNLINPDGELTAQGKWTTGPSSSNSRSNASKNQTTLKYQLDLINAGKMLERFGYAHVIVGGKGKLTGEVNWAGSPYSLDVPTLSGKIQLDLQSGQFLKVEPGAAKLLAVLNLQALPRRLMLDFRDVFSEGFAFDGITGDALIEKGVLKTDNMKMRSVSATVLLSGTADIAGETQNLHVVVVPEVNAGAASIVYGLAVNPVIGLGTFLAQLFLRAPLMRAFTFEYQVTGPWKEPNVVKL